MKVRTPQQKSLQAKARDVKKAFLELAENLDKHHNNVNIARTTGSSVAILAGSDAMITPGRVSKSNNLESTAQTSVVAIGCGIAAPFTLGATILAAIVAGSFAAAGGVTSGGAGVVNFGISKHTLKKAERIWTEFKRQYAETAADISRRLDSTWGAQGVAVGNMGRMIWDTARAARGALALAEAGGEAAARGGVATGASATGRAAGTAASTAARVGSALTSVMVITNVVLIGISVFDLVDASLEIHRERKSAAGEVLRQLVKELDLLIDEKDPVIFPDAAESED